MTNDQYRRLIRRRKLKRWLQVFGFTAYTAERLSGRILSFLALR